MPEYKPDAATPGILVEVRQAPALTEFAQIGDQERRGATKRPWRTPRITLANYSEVGTHTVGTKSEGLASCLS
jgi:hypothetical protein